MKTSRMAAALRLALAGGLSFVTLYPVFFTINAAFKSESDYMQSPFSLALPPTTASLERVANFAFLPMGYVATGAVVVFSVLGLWIVGGLAAYRVALVRDRGGSFVFLLVLLGMMVPIQTIIQPFFIVVSRLGLVDQYYGLVLAFVATLVPLTTFQLAAYFGGLPHEVIEAARVDGASPLRIFSSVVVPMARPAFVATGLLNTIWVLGDFLLPLLMMQRPERQMLVVRLGQIRGIFAETVPVDAAAVVLLVAPIVVIYFIAQRHLVRGVTAGAVK